jgi:hypothetical protein
VCYACDTVLNRILSSDELLYAIDNGVYHAIFICAMPPVQVGRNSHKTLLLCNTCEKDLTSVRAEGLVSVNQ